MPTPNLDHLQEAVDNHLLLCQLDPEAARHNAIFKEGLLSVLIEIATPLREIKEKLG